MDRFCRLFFGLSFLAAFLSAFLRSLVDLFPWMFSRHLPYSRLLGSCWFLLRFFFLALWLCFSNVVFKNEFQRGATTWVTSSLNLGSTNPPTGRENYELYALSPPRGLCLRPLQALPHPPCFALVEPFLWLCGGRVLGTSCLLEPT